MSCDDFFCHSRGGAAVSGPLFDLGQFVDEEDAFALSLSTGLHDPSARRVLAELLHKQIIISGEHESHRNKICTKHRANSYKWSEQNGTPCFLRNTKYGSISTLLVPVSVLVNT